MTFYLILKNGTNGKYVKREVVTQNKQKWIVYSKNIIINKFMIYFYAEKFCLINFPMIPDDSHTGLIPAHTLSYIIFVQDQPSWRSWQSTPHHMACDVNLGRVGTHYPLHSSRSNRNTEVVTKRLRVDAHFKGNITSTQCFESSRIEKRWIKVIITSFLIKQKRCRMQSVKCLVP